MFKTPRNFLQDHFEWKVELAKEEILILRMVFSDA